MGTGCARGFLAAFDTAWMVKSWAQGKPPLDILAERYDIVCSYTYDVVKFGKHYLSESIYRLLPQTTPENITKNFDLYTIDPTTRYPNLNSSCVRPHQILAFIHLDILTGATPKWELQRHHADSIIFNFLNALHSLSGVGSTDFDSLNEEDAVRNNQLAFNIAEREFGIPPVITGKEMVSAGEPDKLSMVMYLSKFYELFRGTPLRAVGTLDKQNGERNDVCSTKSTNFIFNNYINLTFPRKRVPKAEENETIKRRRKSLINFEESSSCLNQGTISGNQLEDVKEAINGNKVKSMATQLLAKFEENAPNVSIRRHEVVAKPALHLSPEYPVNPRFAKPKEPTCNPPPPPKSQVGIHKEIKPLLENANLHKCLLTGIHRSWCKYRLSFDGKEILFFILSVSQFQAIARADHRVREPAQSLPGAPPVTRYMGCAEPTELKSSLSETLASSCPAAFALSGVLQRLQHVEEKINQKRAQSIANREFHKKSIKEKAAHLASMFGYVDIPKNKLPTKDLSHSQHPSPSCLPSHGSAASSSSIDSASPAIHSKKMTVGKVSRGIGAVAQVLVNLYMNDHRPTSLQTNESADGAVAAAASFPPLPYASPAFPSTVQSCQGSLRKEFPQSIGGSDICCFCKKRVYVMERLSAEGHFFHRECFKCAICATTLRLAMYAFDAEEDKFYCKLHFAQCKTKNTHRKRRAMLKMCEKGIGREEAELFRQEEPMSAETTAESAFAAGSISEDRSPGILPSFFRKTLSWPLKVTRDLLHLPRQLSNWMHGFLHATRLHFGDNAYNYTYLYELLSFSMPFLFALQELLAHIYREVDLSCENMLELVKKFFRV
ncbi:hypothetical protein JD844_021743 [Phrynosoma platyrhinos]|uniref:LIM zinc-binding domain-containing protein n=1 Tax=Phrynosoma platyrhinos TaxID=52577 RepID=A0ABQ7STY9_PHRPL|nr:hypothetical protein JD844_021743 [Phrynosoma platyrhinos]